MRRIAIAAAITATIVAAPAAAQLVGSVGADVGVGTGVVVDTGRTVGSVIDTVDRTGTRAVTQADRLANRTIAGTQVTLVSRTDVRSGAEVRDSRGKRVGTVQEINGDTAVVVSGQRAYHVPLASLYRSASGKARTLYTAVPRTQLAAHAAAQANAQAHAGH